MIVLHEDKLEELHEKIYVWQTFVEALASTNLNSPDDTLNAIRKIINGATMNEVEDGGNK